ncbi:MAG: alpha-glucosidase, partial [Lachnospiraceae bacterium]|nr:alpha-glucosidase [Lachnospiraceae bacterium]
DLVYGLGETVRGMNKRGWIYVSNNADDPHHQETTRSLYGAHNFFVVFDTNEAAGWFIDTPGCITFDVGYTKADELVISFEDMDAEIYQFEGKTPLQIVKEFRGLIGRSYLPPKWAFGYGQSRWGYRTAEEVRTIAERYRELGIPLDMIYLDIDYMDDFQDFTVNEETFPHFADFVGEMKSKGIHLIPIIDAGVKVKEGYPTYEEGVKGGYFVTKEDGSLFTAAVWPGHVHFPDFLDEKARAWFGASYQVLLDQGIDGFWNDMNEPAIFYTPEHLQEVLEALNAYQGKNLGVYDFFTLQNLVGRISNHPEDYRRFYHNYLGGCIRHDKVHNLYGFNMTRAAGEAFERLRPGERILLFSRSSYIGAHRYGGIWTGDNSSWWSHILLVLQQMPGLHMCGFLFTGSDTGGFGENVTEDLMMRWLAVSMFTPLFRNHSALGSREQELYQFARVKEMRDLVQLRYALIPYLYSEFMKAALRDEMYFVPLAFAYLGDERAMQVEDQLLVGESIMIAPVYTQNAKGRYVYLPERMKLLRFRSVNDYDEMILEAGDHFVRAELNEVLIFLRPGHVLPLAKPALTVPEIDTKDLNYLTFEAEPASYELYED